MLKYGELIEKVSKAPVIGFIIETKDNIVGEVVSISNNYITIIMEDFSIKKIWCSDVKKIVGEGKQFPARSYKPKHLTEDLMSLFHTIEVTSENRYAIFNCVNSLDELHGIVEIKNKQDFMKYRTLHERVVKYFSKFSLDENVLSQYNKKLVSYAIMEGCVLPNTPKRIILTTINSYLNTSLLEDRLLELLKEDVLIYTNTKKLLEGKL